ncbi:MAG: hypothetical protein QW082_03290 [Nitrososphaerota archaeon]
MQYCVKRFRDRFRFFIPWTWSFALSLSWNIAVLSLRYLKNFSTLFLMQNLWCSYSSPSLWKAYGYHGPLLTMTLGLLKHSLRAFLRNDKAFRALLP